MVEKLFVNSLKSGNVNHARALLALASIDLNEPLADAPERHAASTHLPLEIAIEVRNLEIIRLLIEHGAGVKLIGRHYAHYAVLYSDEGVMRLLLPLFEGNIPTAWMGSLRHGNDACTELPWDRLIGSEKESHEVMNEAFIVAIKHGTISNVRELLRRGADVNFISERGNQIPMTALQLAVDGIRNVEDMVKLLVEAGAKTDTDLGLRPCGERAFTPLESAIFHRNYGVASLLIGQSANVNTPMRHCWSKFSAVIPYRTNALKLALCHTTSTVSYENFVTLLLITPGACADEESFAFAVQNGDDSMIEILSSFGASYCSVPVLVASAETGRLDIAQRCLDAGANINGLWEGKTPLTAAIGKEDRLGNLLEKTWRFLLHKGASVNALGTDKTPLQMAFEAEDEPLINSLLDMGARCDGCTSIFDTTAFKERPELVEVLVQRGACIRPKDLEEVVRTQGEDFILALIEKDPKTFIDGILLHAGERGLHFLKEVLDIAASHVPDFEARFRHGCLGHDILIKAVQTKDSATIALLLENGVNVSSKCMFEMFNWVSLHYGDLSWIEVFVSAGIPWESPRETNYSPSCSFESRQYLLWGTYSQPLHNLVSQGYLEAAQFLLRKGADPNLIAIEEWDLGTRRQIPLLNSAVIGGQISGVKLLLEAGSNVNLPAMGYFGRTALQAAIDEGQFEIMDQLLVQGADVNTPAAEDAGITALQAAAIHGYLGIAVRLVELGADVNAAAARNEGRTALEGASEHGRIDMVQFLLNAGADVQSPKFGEEQYRRAVGFARENGFPAVARVLERHRSTLG